MNAGMPDFYDCKKWGMLILTDGNRKKQNAFINDFPDFELVHMTSIYCQGSGTRQ